MYVVLPPGQFLSVTRGVNGKRGSFILALSSFVVEITFLLQQLLHVTPPYEMPSLIDLYL